MQINIPQDIAEYLAQKGVLARIEASQQAEREEQRAQLFKEIADLKKGEAELMPVALAAQQRANKQLEAAVEALQKARIAVNEADSQVCAIDVSCRVEKRLHKIATLADPRIHKTIIQLREFEEHLRQNGFNTWISSTKNFLDGKVRAEHSNAEELNAACAEIRQMGADLEALCHTSHPENLDDILEGKLSAAEVVGMMVGVKLRRDDRLAISTRH